MTTTQSHIQDQLQRKHEELQQLIVQQQEELRHVSEQLLIARYGLLPSIVNVAVPFNPIGHVSSRTSQSHGNILSTCVTPSGHQSISQIDNNASNANNQMSHCNSAIEQIDNQRNVQSHNDEIVSYIELQSTPNTANSERLLEQHSMASLHEHQRQHSHERQSIEPTWESTSGQQIIHMQPQQSGNVQGLPRSSLLQSEASNTQQSQCDNRHLPGTAIATTTPASAEDLEILPDYWRFSIRTYSLEDSILFGKGESDCEPG